MSRSSKSNLIVRDDGIELLLGFAETADIVKDNLGFFVLLGSFCDPDLDGVDDCQRTISVIDYLYCIVHTRDYYFRHIRAIVAVHGFCATAPDEQSALDGHVIERDFSVCCAAADNQITVQNQFGFQYIKDFMGYNTIFLLSSGEIARGKVIATPVDNIVLYYVDPADSDFSKAGLVYTTAGEASNLIGFHTQGNYHTAVSESFAVMGMTLFAEYLDGISVQTITPGE